MCVWSIVQLVLSHKNTHTPCSLYLDLELDSSKIVPENYLISRDIIVCSKIPSSILNNIIVDYKKLRGDVCDDESWSHILRFLKKLFLTSKYWKI